MLRPALLRLALLCGLVGGARALLARDEGASRAPAPTPAELQRMRDQRRAENQRRTQALADKYARELEQRTSTRKWTHVAETQVQRKADEERAARAKARADEMAALRPIVQAQRKAERERLKKEREQQVEEEARRAELEEAKRKAEEGVRLRAMQEARDQVMQEMQARAQAMRDQVERERRRQALKAKWQATQAARREAEAEAQLPEEERQQLAAARAQQAAELKAKQDLELELKQKAEERKRQKEERDRNWRVAQRKRAFAEAEQQRKLLVKEQRNADYEAQQRAKEAKREVFRAREDALPEREEEPLEERAPRSLPDAGRHDDTVLLTVRHSEGDEVQLRVARKARLQVVLSTVGKRLGVDQGSLSLERNGSPLRPTDSISAHDLKDGDVLEATSSSA